MQAWLLVIYDGEICSFGHFILAIVNDNFDLVMLGWCEIGQVGRSSRRNDQRYL